MELFRIHDRKRVRLKCTPMTAVNFQRPTERENYNLKLAAMQRSRLTAHVRCRCHTYNRQKWQARPSSCLMERDIERPRAAAPDTVSVKQEGVHFHILELDFRFYSVADVAPDWPSQFGKTYLHTFVVWFTSHRQKKRQPNRTSGCVGHWRDENPHNLARLLCCFR